jgi:hypothetical protein
MVETDRAQMKTIRSTRFACWLNKATHTHTHTLRICNTYNFYTATMIRERSTMLRYTYIACLAVTA